MLIRLSFLVCLVVFCSFNSIAQDYLWVKNLGDGANFKEIKEVPNNRIIVVGSFFNITFLDSTYASDDGDGVFIAAYDLEGNEFWIHTMSNTDDVELYSMDTDASGNIYLLGYTSDPLTFQGQVILAERGHFLLKLDPSGNLLWFDDQYDEDADFDQRVTGIIDLEDMSVTPEGEIYVAVRFRNSFEIGGETFTARSNPFTGTFRDPLLVKYNASGSIAWAVQGKSQWTESEQQLAIDGEGNPILIGMFSGNDENNIGLSFGSLPELSNSQSGDGVFLAKFNSSGTPLWLKSLSDDAELNTLDENEQPRDIAVEGEQIIVSINFSDEIIIDGTIIENPGPNRGDFPFDGNVVAKLDPNGNLLWHQVFAAEQAFAQVASNSIDKSVTILGSYNSLFFPQAGKTLADERVDFFIAQLDSTGILVDLDSTEYTRSNRDALADIYPITHLSDGSLIFATGFNGGADVTFGNITLPNPGTVLARREPNLPFFVNLGPDRGQCQGEIVLDAGSVEGGATYMWSTGEQTQTITVNQSGTYSVEVTNADNEVASDEINITIEEPLQFAFPDTIVGFNNVLLTAPIEGFSYLWSTGEKTESIIVTSAGTYSLTVRTEFGCETIDDVVVVIEVLSIFLGGSGSGYTEARTENNLGAFYNGGNASGYFVASLEQTGGFFNGSEGSGYFLAILEVNGFYEGGDGSGYALFTTSEDEQAFYKGRDGSGYASFLNSEDRLAFFEGGVGSGYVMGFFDGVLLSIIAPEFSNIKLYPNPANDQVFFDRVDLATDNGLLNVYDVNGKKINEMMLDRGSQLISLDVSTYQSGLYLIEYYSESKKQSQVFRLIIE